MLVSIVIPVYNEKAQLAQSIARLHAHVRSRCPFDAEIVIADNGSTDGTLEVAHSLAKRHDGVRPVHLRDKGRGRALKRCWTESSADILSYMDVDLSTDLDAFPGMISALAGGGFDVAAASRLLNPRLVTRSLKRGFISRSYNLLIKAFFRTTFSDAQCGFKAITRTAARELLPLVEDAGWFFDTELLVLAEKLGYRIFDFPARWVDDPDSRVNLWQTAVGDFRGLLRLRRNVARGAYASAGVARAR